MSPSERLGALVGVVTAIGLLLMLTSLPVMRRRHLADRVAPWAGVVAVGAGRAADPGSMSALWRPTTSWITARLLAVTTIAFSSVTGDDVALRRRLRSAGLGHADADLTRHRHEQIVWCLIGALVSGLMLSAIVASRGPVPVVAAAMLSLLVITTCVLIHDRRLTVTASRRRERMSAELPVAAELMALAIGAGESPAAALDRLARASSGLLADQFADAAQQARSGVPVLTCLRQVADDANLTPLRRMVDAIVTATDRGTPLADVLRAQAADLRGEAARAIVESAGRREIAMLIPVVFLVMPTVVVVAMFPGWQALQSITP
jgi:tight adherence protein C